MATVLLLAIVVVLLMAGCAREETPPLAERSPASPGGEGPSAIAWLDAELTDVATGETFRISDFRGRPVIVKSFAVWCSVCSRQLAEMARLVRMTDDVVVVAIDLDQNEDAALVLEHIERNDFAGHFAISSQELTRALIDEFGTGIANPPRSPKVLVNADQTSATYFDGVKTAEDLREAAEGAR
jgi:cytochrome oxidase Cu insertion factor (SCO1/SenC/PrrC family)